VSILTAPPTQSVRELFEPGGDCGQSAIRDNDSENAMRQWAADRITAEATPRPAASVVMRRA